MVERRDKFQGEYLNKDYAKSVYKREWDKITKDGTYEKIINYTECPNDCSYSSFSIETKGLSCKCKASNINIDSDNINIFRNNKTSK